ncbi:hypothetical protein ACB092_11G075400 [Castanea dentata]
MVVQCAAFMFIRERNECCVLLEYRMLDHATYIYACLVMSLIGSLLTMLVVSFFSCKLMCLLLLVVVMLHLVQGYIILKLVYFIILTLISMTDIDTSLCFYVNIMFVWRHLWYCFSRTKIITGCL